MECTSVRLSELSILLFRLKENCFGIDTQAIEGLLSMDELCDDSLRILKVHELLQTPDDHLKYREPKIVRIRETSPPTGIIVDQPEVLPLPVEVKTIQRLPTLVAPFVQKGAVWGACLVENQVVLLMDPHEAIRMKDALKAKEK